MCLTSAPKVRTPLNSPWVGAKSYLSSGMAAAAGTTAFSVPLSCLSSTEAKVGFGSGDDCGSAAMAVAVMARLANRQQTAMRIFIIENSSADGAAENLRLRAQAF